MKSKLYLLITFILSLFIFCNCVKADNNMVMWLDCNYSVYEENVDKLEKGRSLVFIGGYNSEKKTDGYYRLLNPRIFAENRSGAEQVWHERDNPRFEGCWLISSGDIGSKCNENNSYSEEEALRRLRSGICPAVIRMDKKEKLVFAGEGTARATYSLVNQYRFYKFNNTVEAYGYDINGFFLWTKNGEIVSTHSYDANNIGDLVNRRIMSTSGIGIDKFGTDFMRVGELDYSAILNHKDSVIIFDSNKFIGNLYKELDKWYSDYGSVLDDKSEAMNKINTDYQKLINSCTVLNERYESGKNYTFNSQYSAKNMLNDLENAFPKLENFYEVYSNKEVNKYKMCISDNNATTSSAVDSAYNCSMVNLLGDINYVPKDLQQYVMKDINHYLTNDKGLYLDETSDNNGTINTLLKCSSYLYRYSDSFGIDKDAANNIREKYADLAKSRDIYFVYDCESLLGRDLINKINSYLNIIKIAIPIILIALGIVDFTKAIFSDDDAMKKAQKTFIKRCFIAFLIFITPIILNLILQIANQVWDFISPGSCGLF